MGNTQTAIGGEKTIKQYSAIAVFFGDIKGNVIFSTVEAIVGGSNKRNNIKIDIALSGFVPNTIHGFHIHRCGDMSKMCDSMCDHFNPYNKTHGGGHNTSSNRHAGDLGNITADGNGNVNITIYDNYISLKNGHIANIIGRGLVIHADEDDCGLGGDKESLITGNSGKRIACAVIGIKEY